MGKIKYQSIKVDNEESWQFLITLRTYDTKSHKAVPWNITSMFVVMHVDNVDGILQVSASTDTSNDTMARALCGQAVLNFPLSSTTAISAGLYNHTVYVADLPYLTSATYIKKVSQGPFEVE